MLLEVFFMHFPKVSIITAVYNSEEFLPQYFDSILSLNYPNLEVVLVDGLSSDNSVGIIRSYSDKLSLVFISENDAGTYDALNKGISLASGDYLIFLGADDKIASVHAINSIFEDCKLTEFDLIYGKFRFSGTDKVRGGPRDQKSILLNNICHQAIFYHRSVFSIVGNYDLDFPICADFDFNIRCFLEPRIRTKFVNTVIGCFQSGGASFAGCDDQFLLKQKRLIIDKMGYLAYYFNTIKQKLLLIAKKSGVIT